MLNRLYIKQFAIIDDMTIDFHDNFTVLTGETGAGKSIVIDAVSLLLGARASSEMIRHGSDKAYVEGEFTVNSKDKLNQLNKLELMDEDNTLIIAREISTNGKNICRINGRAVSLSLYKEAVEGLIDIHGQHDYQQLMQSQKQFVLADSFGGKDLEESLNKVKTIYKSLKQAIADLENARNHKEEILAKIDFLKFQINEIEEANLVIGEDEEINAELTKLVHGEKILKSIDKANNILFKDSFNAYDLLSTSLSTIKDLGKYDSSLDEIYNKLEPCRYILEDVGRDLDDYRDNLDINPERTEELESRSHKIKTLCNKYGKTIADILAKRDELSAELSKIDGFSASEESMVLAIDELKKQYDKEAAILRDKRNKVKSVLEENVNKEIHELKMENADFVVEITPTEATAVGTESIEFIISTNKGEPYLPLSKIASGGELSRITLGMKRVLAFVDSSDSMVFDEIDSGMGGETTYAVADKLSAISRDSQIICITHSAIIASKANQHLYIQKQENNNRTNSSITEINGETRIGELARMLGGKSDDKDLRNHAKSLLSKGN